MLQTRPSTQLFRGDHFFTGDFSNLILRYIGFHGVFWIYSAASLAMAVYAYLVDSCAILSFTPLPQVIPDNRGLSLVRIEKQREKQEEKILPK